MVNVEGFAALPASQNAEDWLCPEGNGYDAQSQMRGLETIFAARHNGRGPDSSLKRLLIFRVDSCVPSVTLGTVTQLFRWAIYPTNAL